MIDPTLLPRLGTAALSDALGKRGAMDHRMQCRTSRSAMAGPAFTAQVHKADLLMVSEALARCPAGSVLVIDGRGDLDTALWGELTTYRAEAKGLAGVVIDGAVRDSAKIHKSPLPVFARAVVPAAGGAEYVGELQITVSCGGQVVRPGDWVVGDDDGVVVIPGPRLEAVMERARAIVEAEAELERAIRGGADLAELLRVRSVIEAKRAGELVPQLRGREEK